MDEMQNGLSAQGGGMPPGGMPPGGMPPGGMPPGGMPPGGGSQWPPPGGAPPQGGGGQWPPPQGGGGQWPPPQGGGGQWPPGGEEPQIPKGGGFPWAIVIVIAVIAAVGVGGWLYKRSQGGSVMEKWERDFEEAADRAEREGRQDPDRINKAMEDLQPMVEDQ